MWNLRWRRIFCLNSIHRPIFSKTIFNTNNSIINNIVTITITIANNIILLRMKIIGTVDVISKSTVASNIIEIDFIFLILLTVLRSFETFEDIYQSKWCIRRTRRLHFLATLLWNLQSAVINCSYLTGEISSVTFFQKTQISFWGPLWFPQSL